MNPLNIPENVLHAAYAHARATFPSECCGWMTGPKGGDGVTDIRPCQNRQLEGQHPTASTLPPSVAYVMSVEDATELDESLRTETPARIIFHSHPNSSAFFSSIDVEVALSPWGDGPALPVQQLVVGLDGEKISSAALFDWCDESKSFVEIARYAGAQI